MIYFNLLKTNAFLTLFDRTIRTQIRKTIGIYKPAGKVGISLLVLNVDYAYESVLAKGQKFSTEIFLGFNFCPSL
jgi:hypothetical protein